MNDEKESIWDSFFELRKIYQEQTKQYEKETDEWWDNLEYYDRLRAFYSVCKRIHQGDVIERTSYRGVLYDVFGFDMDAYAVGMECNYLDLHNLIIAGLEKKEFEK